MSDRNKLSQYKDENILVISRSDETIACIYKIIIQIGYAPLVANCEKQALELLKSKRVSYILIEVDQTDTRCDGLVNSMRVHAGHRYVPILILATTYDEEQLSRCNEAGCDDFIFKPFNLVSLSSRIASLNQIRDLEYLYKDSLNEQLVAKRILNSALEERSLQFDEIGILSKSKSVFSGDLFLTARHPDGSLNVLMADFTGHGLSAAIGALPVADTFSVMTEKGFDLEFILENINRKLYTLLPTSMFMACSALSITNDLKCMKVWNGGMPDIYVRAYDKRGIKHRIKSSHIPLGIDEKILNRFELQTVKLSPDDQLILYTDGLTDAMNSESQMFGHQLLDKCLHENAKDKSVFEIIVASFNDFCGEVAPADDVTLAFIPCTPGLMSVTEVGTQNNIQLMSGNRDRSWCWYLELGGESLHAVNPIPIVINEIHKLSEGAVKTEKLFSIMTALYQNVINKKSAVNDTSRNTISKNNIGGDIYLRIGIQKLEVDGEPALLVQMEDSGKEVTNDKLINYLNNEDNSAEKTCNGSMPLLYELNKSLNKQNIGNRFEAIVCEHL
jgi:DNA-binding response OmpR family regulator